MAREGVEIAVQSLDVDLLVGRSLGAVQDHDGAGLMGQLRDCRDGVDRAEGVGHMSDGDDPGLVA